MNYVVIDTNAIVSALLATNRKISVPFSVLEAVFQGKITPVITQAIMDEYVNVLNREKFGFDKTLVKVVLSELEKQAVKINPPVTNITLPDSKDKCFYEAALVYENIGGLLVTGNIKHFPDCPFAVTPTKLKERLGW